MAEEKRFERKKEREPEQSASQAPFSLDAKIKAIKESKMPEKQKQDYLLSLGVVEAPSDEGKMPFTVFAKVKGIELSKHKAMLAFPKARGKQAATLGEWEEIFKDF